MSFPTPKKLLFPVEKNRHGKLLHRVYFHSLVTFQKDHDIRIFYKAGHTQECFWAPLSSSSLLCLYDFPGSFIWTTMEDDRLRAIKTHAVNAYLCLHAANHKCTLLLTCFPQKGWKKKKKNNYLFHRRLVSSLFLWFLSCSWPPQVKKINLFFIVIFVINAQVPNADKVLWYKREKKSFL